MRKLILIAGLVLTGACASTPSDSSGWTAEQRSEAREAFLEGYGEADSFGLCGFNYFTDNYSFKDVQTMSEADMEPIIDAATAACAHLVN